MTSNAGKSEVVLLGTDQFYKEIQISNEGMLPLVHPEVRVHVRWPLDTLRERYSEGSGFKDYTEPGDPERWHYPLRLGVAAIPETELLTGSFTILDALDSYYGRIGLIAVARNVDLTLASRTSAAMAQGTGYPTLVSSWLARLFDAVVPLYRIDDATPHERFARIAVVDSGVAQDVVTRYGNICEPVDLTQDNSTTGVSTDSDGHGTIITELIATLTDERSTVHPIKAMGGVGAATGTIETLLSALVHASEIVRADICNVSMGVRMETDRRKCLHCGVPVATSRDLSRTMNFLYQAISPLTNRMLLVSSVGNKPGDSNVTIPAACPGVVAVGACGPNGVNRYSFWRVPGDRIVFAPGGSRSYPIGRGAASEGFGTSFSSAIASSIAALHLNSFPCGRPSNVPIPSLFSRMLSCGSPIKLPNGQPAVSVIPVQTIPDQAREHCKGACVAYRDSNSYRGIFRGRLL